MVCAMDWTDFLAGSLAGSAGVFVGHPLDTLKVRLQTLPNLSLVRCIVRTYQHEKVKGFYRGLTFPLVSSGAINFLFFGTYGTLCRWLGEHDYGKASKGQSPNYGIIYLAGCGAGVVQLSLSTLVEVVKVKIQAQVQGLGKPMSGYHGSVDCFRKLWTGSGVRGCYQGLSVQIFRDVPSYGIYMLTYEWLSFWLSDLCPHDMVATAIAGGCAGTISWGVITPLDVIKSRIQADHLPSPKYDGAIDCLLKSYREAGLPVFFRGLGPSVARAFPTNAATLLVYSWALTFFDRFAIK